MGGDLGFNSFLEFFHFNFGKYHCVNCFRGHTLPVACHATIGWPVSLSTDRLRKMNLYVKTYNSGQRPNPCSAFSCKFPLIQVSGQNC